MLKGVQNQGESFRDPLKFPYGERWGLGVRACGPCGFFDPAETEMPHQTFPTFNPSFANKVSREQRAVRVEGGYKGRTHRFMFGVKAFRAPKVIDG